jgi:hypothetical protein
MTVGARARFLAIAAQQRRLPMPAADLPLSELVRLGTLAASSHNTQPWHFACAPDRIVVRPDLDRRCPVVDPDDSHLWKSLGCAVENIVVAAPAFGRGADIELDVPAGRVTVHVPRCGEANAGPLYAAIAMRQCTRVGFDGRPLSSSHRAALAAAESGRGVRTIWIDGNDERRDRVRRLVREGNMAQLRDSAFRRELVSWLRFSTGAAIATGDGLAGISSGRPTLPQPLGRLLAPLVVTAGAQARADDGQLAVARRDRRRSRRADALVRGGSRLREDRAAGGGARDSLGARQPAGRSPFAAPPPRRSPWRRRRAADLALAAGLRSVVAAESAPAARRRAGSGVTAKRRRSCRAASCPRVHRR